MNWELINKQGETITEKEVIEFISFCMIEADETFMESLRWSCQSEFCLDVEYDELKQYITIALVGKVMELNYKTLMNYENAMTFDEVTEWSKRENRYTLNL
jgi:hypothetical protein